MFIATLIAAERLSQGDVAAAHDALASAGCRPERERWIDDGLACDIELEGDPLAARTVLEGLLPRTDVVVQPAPRHRTRLFVADMDSTMIEGECLDELADYAGLKAEVAAITERAMAGELDFGAALALRLSLLVGVGRREIEACHGERVRHAPGAATLVRTMRGRGAHTLLVTGGFDVFANRVGGELGFDQVVSNRLCMKDGAITGEMDDALVDSRRKRGEMVAARERLGLTVQEVVAVGDGANDAAMIGEAGLGIGYRPKAALAAVADAVILHADLTAILHAQGIARRNWL